jgi:hypothetical protein
MLTNLLEGGARLQSDQLQARKQKELDASNALELMEYDAAVAAYPRRTPCRWQSGMLCSQKVGAQHP